MDELNWPKMLNNVLTDKWYQLKNTLVMKDFVDFLIQRRVVTLDYWMALKAKPISESERTEDFLFHVMKFNREKYKELLNALEMLGRRDLVKALSVVKENCPQRSRRHTFISQDQGDAGKAKTSKPHGEEAAATARLKSSSSRSSRLTIPSARSDQKLVTTKFQSTVMQHVYQQALRHYDTGMIEGKHSVLSPRKSSDETKGDKTMLNKREIKDTSPNMEHQSEQAERKTSATSRKSAESARRREVVLDTRESFINTREQDLRNRTKLLEEQEDILRQKEMDVKAQQILSEKIKEDTENELKCSNIRTDTNTSIDQSDNGRSPSMTPIRSREIKHHLQTVKTDIEHLKGNNEVLQEKMEDQKHEMGQLNERIGTLENEKSEAERIRLAEVSKLKQDLTDTKTSYTSIVKSLREEIQSKESECQEMKVEIHELESICKGLSGRLQLVEEDKAKTEKELKTHTEEISSLRFALDQKECEIINLKKDLDKKVIANSKLSKQVIELKSENCSLVEHKGRIEKYHMEREAEVLDLKHELTKLRTDNWKLEQEKKRLLGRFVKPDWTHTRNSTLYK